MSEVVKLTVVPSPEIPSVTKQAVEKFDSFSAEMKAWLEKTKSGGFVLIAYDKTYENNTAQLHSWVNYFVSDPGDSFWLPDMAKARLINRRDE